MYGSFIRSDQQNRCGNILRNVFSFSLGYRSRRICAVMMTSVLLFASFPEKLYSYPWEEALLKKIEEAEVISEPFPYLVIDDFFPQEYYEEAFSKYPSSALSSPIGGTRRVCYIHPDHPENRLADPMEKAFWGRFVDWMNRVIKPALVEKFSPLYLRKFDLRQYELYQEFIREHFAVLCDSVTDKLTFDPSGYEIVPHVDKAFIYLKVLIYFAENRTQALSGTYVLESDRKEHGLFYLDQEEEFSSETLIEYLPNRLVVMMQTPKSWHCVKSHSFSGTRKTFNGSIFCDFTFMKTIDSDEEIVKRAALHG